LCCCATARPTTQELRKSPWGGVRAVASVRQGARDMPQALSAKSDADLSQGCCAPSRPQRAAQSKFAGGNNWGATKAAPAAKHRGYKPHRKSKKKREQVEDGDGDVSIATGASLVPLTCDSLLIQELPRAGLCAKAMDFTSIASAVARRRMQRWNRRALPPPPPTGPAAAPAPRHNREVFTPLQSPMVQEGLRVGSPTPRSLPRPPQSRGPRLSFSPSINHTILSISPALRREVLADAAERRRADTTLRQGGDCA
jgi:hypothetical protein